MKKISALIVLTVFAAFAAGAQNSQGTTSNTMKTLYDFSATTIDGQPFPMSELKGKKVMIVNVASNCGYTPQYKQLQELYLKYKDKGLVILGFPCNQFMGQEPGDEADIKSFCEKNYGVTFPLFSKIDVKGKDQHPIYQWLTSKTENGVEDSDVSWNFNKYLVDENGRYVMHLKSGDSPTGDKVTAWLEGK